jgi:hypothetical protein
MSSEDLYPITRYTVFIVFLVHLNLWTVLLGIVDWILLRDETRGGEGCLSPLPTFVKNQAKRAPFLPHPEPPSFPPITPRLLNSKPVTLSLLPSKKRDSKITRYIRAMQIVVQRYKNNLPSASKPDRLSYQSILHRISIPTNTMPIYLSISISMP